MRSTFQTHNVGGFWGRMKAYNVVGAGLGGEVGVAGGGVLVRVVAGVVAGVAGWLLVAGGRLWPLEIEKRSVVIPRLFLLLGGHW